MTSSPRLRQPRYLDAHLLDTEAALEDLGTHLSELDGWSCWLADVLHGGGRLLVAGNGGSAALAAHLAAELVGRFRAERLAFSALALQDAGTLTALANDYGYEHAFSRQVAAHGRPGDVLLALSTSGRSPNLLRATEQARSLGIAAWALTGPGPNPLGDCADAAVCLRGPTAAAVQEAQQVAVHLLCVGFDHHLAHVGTSRSPARPPANAPAGSRADEDSYPLPRSGR